MGYIAIRKIMYSGDDYQYVSPNLSDGINIFEGGNGSGKSTLVELINYGFGFYVKQFDSTTNEKHTQICSDSNNYVSLNVEINDVSYVLKRYFGTNLILVTEDSINVETYYIYRQSADYIFSDWLLERLGIEPVEIYQGTKSGKIGFEDLFRLIHYEQKSNPNKIYKEHRKDSNFVADSIIMRKSIFEILTGYKFGDYYSKIGDVKVAEREKAAQQLAVNSFLDILKEHSSGITFEQVKDYTAEISELNSQLEKLENYREELLEKDLDIDSLDDQTHEFKERLIHVDYEYSKTINHERDLLIELTKIEHLKEDRLDEINHLKKIIFTHKELNLFSPNTCPYCFNEVKRTEGHCICGSKVDETQYEKFFYSAKEYFDILKIKEKSLSTLEIAIKSCKEELNEVAANKEDLLKEKQKLKQALHALSRDAKVNYNRSALNNVSDKIFSIESQITNLREHNKLYIKLQELQSLANKKSSAYERVKKDLNALEILSLQQMEFIKNKFNTTYNRLMIDILSDCEKAEIDGDYMPIINGGEYKQASLAVPKKFMYFLTLLIMSLNEDIPYPRFLLVDTPETLGIDSDTLKECISKFEDKAICIPHKKYQIILTTGIGKYPEKFSEYVLERFEKGINPLLKKNKK